MNLFLNYITWVLSSTFSKDYDVMNHSFFLQILSTNLIRSHLYLHLSFFFHGFSRFKIKKKIDRKCKKILYLISLVFLLFFSIRIHLNQLQQHNPKFKQMIKIFLILINYKMRLNLKKKL
jgi:hypothetical protein